MSFIPRKFCAHVKAHQAVIDNEHWFRRGHPFPDKLFTVKKTVKRRVTVSKILHRATNYTKAHKLCGRCV
jgi:hypothetical protein